MAGCTVSVSVVNWVGGVMRYVSDGVLSGGVVWCPV